jgi:hypothetical protein
VGAASRDKVVEIEGAAAALTGRRDLLLGSPGPQPQG